MTIPIQVTLELETSRNRAQAIRTYISEYNDAIKMLKNSVDVANDINMSNEIWKRKAYPGLVSNLESMQQYTDRVVSEIESIRAAAQKFFHMFEEYSYMLERSAESVERIFKDMDDILNP